MSVWSETFQSPHELLDALKRDAAKPTAWHAPPEAIAAVEKLTLWAGRKQPKSSFRIESPADRMNRARQKGIRKGRLTRGRDAK
jgi:hypothetical protein